MNYYSKNNRKEIVLVALLVAIIGMSLGFAAFSNTLSISSSASVTPNSSDFKIIYCDKQQIGECFEGDTIMITPTTEGDGIFGNNAVVYNNYFSGLMADFTSSNQKVIYKVYVQNIGEYDAYLRSVTYTALDNGTYKKCSATTTDETKATDSLVQAACNGINVTMSVGGTSYAFGSDISGHKLEKGGVEEIVFTIEYAAGSALADGPFEVEISDFKLDYSTVDYVNLVTFTIDGTTYQGIDGMSTTDWVNSSYNTGAYGVARSASFCSTDDFNIGSTTYFYSTGTYYSGNQCIN